jgi:hypothetical protein
MDIRFVIERGGHCFDGKKIKCTDCPLIFECGKLAEYKGEMYENYLKKRVEIAKDYILNQLKKAMSE